MNVDNNQHCSLLCMLFGTFPWTSSIFKVLALIVTCVVLHVLWKRRKTVRQWDVLIFYEPLEDPWEELVGNPFDNQKAVIDNETTMMTKKADFYVQHYSYF
ncbi:uncharacterized protein LOC134686076 [Mytilus trossulus]|uniref:uncharacterized protein LOC134686076 n=1 Tax=Mytilus trossulus TaxID=6551 RepID=UPI0030058B98